MLPVIFRLLEAALEAGAFGLVLRALAVVVGPRLRARWPRAYVGLQAATAVVMSLLPELLAAWPRAKKAAEKARAEIEAMGSDSPRTTIHPPPMLILLVMAAALAGCSGAAVRTQTRVAAGVSAAANRALPLWMAEYEREGDATMNRACPYERRQEPACGDARAAALEPVVAKWQAVSAGWEGVRESHARWAERLHQCADGLKEGAQACETDLAAYAAAFASSVTRWRCSVRSIGAERFDEFPLPAPSCVGRVDAGASHD